MTPKKLREYALNYPGMTVGELGRMLRKCRGF